MYRKKHINETTYIVEQRTPRGWRKASEESKGYQDWIAEGNIPEVVPYVAPEPPTLEELKQAKRAEIARAWENDIATVGMPVEGQSFAVDYDIKDALIWGNAVGFLPPEQTEVEIRAIDNSFHALSRTLFEQIPNLQKAYYAQQLQKKWRLQKEADAATTKQDVEAITW